MPFAILPCPWSSGDSGSNHSVIATCPPHKRQQFDSGHVWDRLRLDETGYRYEILAVANGPVSLGYSNVELVVPFAWTDPSLSIGTIVQAAHLTELRSAVNAALGWDAVTFSGTIAAGQTVLRSHLLDLRSGVDTVRAGAGMTAVSNSDPAVTVNVTPIRALHILDLRAALQ